MGALGCFAAAYLRGRNCCSFCSQQRAPGKVLLDAVCNHLNLVEGDYFGLEFPDHKKITVGDVPETLLFYHLFDLREGSLNFYWSIVACFRVLLLIKHLKFAK